MARRPADIERDPAVIVITDGADGQLDDWLDSLRRDGPPTELAVAAADLVADARRNHQ